jgi:hypothetical protein
LELERDNRQVNSPNDELKRTGTLRLKGRIQARNVLHAWYSRFSDQLFRGGFHNASSEIGAPKHFLSDRGDRPGITTATS